MQSLQRAITHWRRIPGNWDTLNFQEIFSSENPYGIPTIGNNGRIPAHLIQWGSRPKLLSISPGSRTAVHFFLDDYRFESLWKNPDRNMDALQNIGQALSPDFSLWRDMPIAMQLWNVYRNRWIGRYWQEHGIQVIPTISWSEPYDFCFMGVEPSSIVAISTVGVIKDKSAHRFFQNGFEKMINVLRPEAIVLYGSLSRLSLETDIPLVTFSTRWEERRLKRMIPMNVYHATPSLWEVQS